MKGYKTNIEKDTIDNNNFRKVLYTSKHIQLVLMTLQPGEEIGEEVHDENDQFFRIESGHGKIRNQCAGHFRGGGHQHLSRQEEADSLRLS